MLDWDTLIPSETSANSPEDRDTPPSVPAGTGFVPGRVGHENNNGNNVLDAFLGTVPVVPQKLVGVRTEGGGGEEENTLIAGDGDGEKDRVREATAEAYPTSPSALLLCLAAGRARRVPREIHVHALLDLAQWPPDEQVRRWGGECRRAGLKPWQVLALPSPGEGKECGGCTHLELIHDYVPDSPRRAFRWACELGYLILEVGKATERILVAPPECGSWERFYPGTGR